MGQAGNPRLSTTFVTFAIGDRRIVHCQANFAALSILAHSEAAASRIVIVTDRPEHYRWLGDRISVIPVDDGTITEWRRPHGYFWRVKLRVMQVANERAPGNLVYLDADVVCRRPLPDFFAALDAGVPFMHKPEYALGSKGGNGRELWRQTSSRRFGPFTVEADNRMWNAGLVALPAAISRAWLADALECLDAMCGAGVDSAFIEQFSLSRSLDRDGRLRPAEGWFIHYWGNKTAWNALLARFLADAQTQQLSFDEACERFRALPLDLPVIDARSRGERLMLSLRKRLFPRDARVASRIAQELER
jgi:hypothetical protein